MKTPVQLDTILQDHKSEAKLIARAKKQRRLTPVVNIDDDITVVYGIRGVGKTWWGIDYCLSKGITAAYVNCEDPRLKQVNGLSGRALAEAIVAVYGRCKVVILDEILKLDIWPEVIAACRECGWRILALNSGEKPSINHEGVMLTSLSWSQYCEWHDVSIDMDTPTGRGLMRNAFEDYLNRGGLPGMQSLRSYRRRLTLLKEEIINKDIIGKMRPSIGPLLNKLAEWIIQKSPLVLSYKELLPNTRVRALNTLRKYVDAVKSTGMFRPLIRLSMFDNVRNFMEKLYAADQGLLADAPRAQRLETAIYLHLERFCSDRGYMMHYYGNRDRQCHFAICKDMRMRAAVEYVPSIDDDDVLQSVLSGFMSLSKSTGCSKLFLLTENNYGNKTVNGLDVEVIPVYAFLIKLSQSIDL